MSNTSIEIHDSVIRKTYIKSSNSRYENEKKFYTKYQYFCPALVSFNDSKRELVIARCTPILEIEGNIKYRDKLWALIERLHEEGANHRDVALSNVVVQNDEPLLIDWESATESIGRVSSDLYGSVIAGIPPVHDYYGADSIWWGGPWDICPGKYWNEVKDV